MIRRLVLACVLFLCCSSSISFGQNALLRAAFATIDSLYNAGSYLSAEVEARRLLEYANLTDTAYAEIHKYIAFSLIAQGKNELAKERFTMLLGINPSYSLDPLLTSPKILVIFNEAKQAFFSRRPAPETAKIPASSDNSAVSYRTVLFPGWEQLYAGRTTSGTIFLSAGIATLGSGIACEILRNNARQDYLAEKNPLAIDDKYKIYNRYYKTEIVSFIAFAFTYLASEIDVFTASPHSPINLHSNVTPLGHTGITFSLKF